MVPGKWLCSQQRNLACLTFPSADSLSAQRCLRLSPAFPALGTGDLIVQGGDLGQGQS